MAHQFDYDFAVIGGGSGGMAAAKEAAKLGAKTVLFDYVTPSARGTKWGLGGTCVNVGCVPKKLMHYAALMGPILRNDAEKFGWKLNSEKGAEFVWETLVENIDNSVRKLNFTYRNGLRSAGVVYVNAWANLSDSHVIDYTDSKNVTKQLSANKILISVGGRPSVSDNVANARSLGLTSDDLFSLPKAPGKTLVVGASYIALETAGFLNEMGFDTTVAVRSVPLRMFDQQCAQKVAEIMEEMGTKFLRKVTVKSLEKQPNGRIQVAFNELDQPDEFDTVIFATGRSAEVKKLNLESLGVKLSAGGKILTNDAATDVESLYALGDCVDGVPELTPTAIRAGEVLARRLFAGSTAKMDYDFVPSTVFTPIEYGMVGLSEEDAIKKYGADDIEVYLQGFTSLEHETAHREKVESKRADEFDTDMTPTNLSKLICVKSQGEKVVGFHFIGPNAGEVTQGFAVALRLGATKSDFDTTIGIHPTDAESFTNLSVTRASGMNYIFGGCGGGKCG